MGSSTPNISSNNIEHLWKPYQNIFNIPGKPTLYTSSLNNLIEAQSYMVPLYASTVHQQEQIYQKRKIPFPNLVAVYNSSHSQNRVNCMIETTFHVVTERIHYRLSNLPKNSISSQEGMYILSSVLNGLKTIYCVENICYITDNMIGIKMDGSVKVWLNENWAINFPVRRIHSEHLMIDQIINVIESYIQSRDGFGISFTITKQQLSPLNFNKVQQLLDICHFSSQSAKLLLQSHFINQKPTINSYVTSKSNDQEIQKPKYNSHMANKTQRSYSNQINIEKHNDIPNYLSNINRKVSNKSQANFSINNTTKLVDRFNCYYPIKNDSFTIKHVNNNYIKKDNLNTSNFNCKITHNTTKHSNIPQNYQTYRINLKQPNNNHPNSNKRFPLTTRYNNSVNPIHNAFLVHTQRSQKQNYDASAFIKKKSSELAKPFQENKSDIKRLSHKIKKQQCTTKVQNKDKEIKIRQSVKNNVEESIQTTYKQYIRNNSPTFTQDSIKTSTKSQQDHKIALDSFKYYLFNYEGQQNTKKNDKQYQQTQINSQQINQQQVTQQYRDQFFLDTIQQASDDESQKSIHHIYV